MLQERADVIKALRDTRYRRGSRRWKKETKRAGKLEAKARRIRREALHEWTTNIVSDAAHLRIEAPASIKEETASPRGDERDWGANVAAVSKLNRHTLNQAPGMALQMFRYKAEEAGIRCDILEDDAPDIGVGRDLVTAGKLNRRAKRAIRKENAT